MHLFGNHSFIEIEYWSTLSKGLVKAESRSQTWQLSVADEAVPESASEHRADEPHQRLEHCAACRDPQGGVLILVKENGMSIDSIINKSCGKLLIQNPE